MTADEEIREILRDLALGQRDLATGQRDHSRRFDGLSSRMDDFERMLSAVTLQTALTAGDIVELKTKLAALDTASWNETARNMQRLTSIGSVVRRRGITVALLVLTGGGVTEVLHAIFH